ncbi:MAG: carbon storage regulator [Pirellulaceae bacterium]
MLILSRREAETVCLGDNIFVTIVAVGNDKVRVGVEAPTGVRILRTELETPTVPFSPPPAIAIIPTAEPKQETSAVLKAMLERANARKNDSDRRAA